MLRAALVLTFVMAGTAAVSQATCGGIETAAYDGPTERYAHGVLGDAIEWGELRLGCASGRHLRLTLPTELVFEDVAPRLADLDGDGNREVIVVESHRDRGARLAIWGLDGDQPDRIAETPFIGTRFRWLAPVGAADLDSDGRIEIAYVDRPHLARVLRVWRYDGGRLVEVAIAGGVTNHRIGERDIAGGIRDCGSGPEMVLASADWQRLVTVRVRDGLLETQDAGPHRDRASFAAAMSCK